jgi:DNA-binding SARP family transcriptional activator
MQQLQRTTEIVTLGRFDIHKQNQSLMAQSSNAKKIWELFKFLFTYRDKSFTPEMLVDQLWPSEEYSDPRGTLRRQMHRLRQILIESTDKPEEQLVIFSNGYYKWNEHRPIHTDVDDFEKLLREGEGYLNIDKKKALESFQQALLLYQGDYLPDCTDQHWVFSVRNHYRRLYLKAVTQALSLLQEFGNYDSMMEVCSNAIKLDIYEEHFHIMFMEALRQKGESKQALEHYEHITRFYYKEMGIKPSDEMKQLYKRLLATPASKSSDDVIATLEDHGPIENAYYCEPDVFKSIFELERRRSQRAGTHFSICVLSIAPKPSYTYAQEGIRHRKLHDHLLMSLRTGDTFTKWSDRQFVVLLPGVDENLMAKVMERVIRASDDYEAISVDKITHLKAVENL